MPAVKSAATSDVWLVRGGLRHPVSQVADEIPPFPGSPMDRSNLEQLDWCPSCEG